VSFELFSLELEAKSGSFAAAGRKERLFLEL
jgi:hypothetical protein